MRFALAAVVMFAAASGRASPASDIVGRPLVLDEGALELRLTAEINVERGRVAQPLSLAPDAWWGVARRWTVGVIHSNASVDRIGAGASLCVRQGGVPGCRGAYRNTGLDLRFSALEGAFALAPRLRALIRDVEPFKPAVTLGAVMRWTQGRFAIASDPYVRLPLANHSLGNRAHLALPLWLAVQPARGWMIALHTGYDADFAVLRDGGHGPFSLGARVRATDDVDVGLEAGWADLLGPQHNGRQAAVLVSVDWRL